MQHVVFMTVAFFTAGNKVDESAETEPNDEVDAMLKYCIEMTRLFVSRDCAC